MDIQKIIENLSHCNTKKETKNEILFLRDSRNYYNVMVENFSNYQALKIVPRSFFNKKH